MTYLKGFLIFACTFFSTLVIASGGDYGGGLERSAQSARVDHTYENGKSLFTGRHSSHRKIKYCFVKEDGSAQKIKSKNIKQFRKQPTNSLISALHRCDDISQNISQVMNRNELISTVYYLNKRYKLKLQ